MHPTVANTVAAVINNIGDLKKQHDPRRNLFDADAEVCLDFNQSFDQQMPSSEPSAWKSRRLVGLKGEEWGLERERARGRDHNRERSKEGKGERGGNRGRERSKDRARPRDIYI